MIMKVMMTITTLPLQLFLPSPINPGLHVQLYEPSVLLQMAFT